MALLIKIFSGKTKTYYADDIPFQTAIKKHSVTGLVHIDESGIVGNETANHKNALYAFSYDNYDYWRKNAKFDLDWQAGIFGENLFLTGLDEHELYIGDTLHIGEVVLQVSGCRTPCSNLLWRLDAPDSFLADFQKSGHSGFYLEVLKVGTVQAGDSIEHKRNSKESISVSDLALFFMNPNPNTAELQRLINIAGMGQQMLSMLTASLNAQRERELVNQDRWSGWHAFTISEIVEESRDVKSFYLTKDANNKALAGYRAGQYLTVKIFDDYGDSLIRCWSISDYDETLLQYRISIKREPEGNASKRIHDHYNVGDSIEIMPPMGQFTLKRNDIAVPVILISAGVGITPMISMLKSHVKRLDKRLPTLHFIHSTQSAKTHAFKEEVTSIIDSQDNFHHHYIYTRSEESSELGIDFQQSKRLDLESLNNVLAGMGCWFAEKWIDVQPFECEFYLCGPSDFIKETKVLLHELCVPDEAIFDESFASEIDFDFDSDLSAAQVNFSHSQQQVTWQPEKPMTLLELAENSGLNPLFSCRSGHCGLCSTKLNGGEVNYVIKPAIELAKQHVLLCCSTPKGDVDLAL